MATSPTAFPWAPRGIRLAPIGLAIAVAAVGLTAFAGYIHDYILYRGFGPPVAMVAPGAQGRVVTLTFASPALGGRTEHAIVYLPAAYRKHPHRRFAVVYLLHGTPGDPKTAFINSLHVAPRMDLLIHRRRVRPFIVVMPQGSPSTYNRATEWANGRARDAQWFTYLTRDVVHAVDTRFRTMRTASGRGIAGFSSGANAALNAILLRPDVYSVAEGWSGDYRQTPGTVGRDAAIVHRFSPVESAARRAAAVAATGAHVYLYAGRRDRAFANTVAVGLALRSGGVHTLLDVAGGGHAWALWSSRLDGALKYFSHHLGGRR